MQENKEQQMLIKVVNFLILLIYIEKRYDLFRLLMLAIILVIISIGIHEEFLENQLLQLIGDLYMRVLSHIR